jgi:hypothetical protein
MTLTRHWYGFAALKPHAGTFGYESLAKLRMSFREVVGSNEPEIIAVHAPVHVSSVIELSIGAGVH